MRATKRSSWGRSSVKARCYRAMAISNWAASMGRDGMEEGHDQDGSGVSFETETGHARGAILTFSWRARRTWADRLEAVDRAAAWSVALRMGEGILGG